MKRTAMALMLASLVAGLTSGCSSMDWNKKPVQNTLDVGAELTKSADSVASSLRRMSELEQANTKPSVLSTIKPSPKVVPVSLDKRVTLSWTGPAAQVLKKVADTAGFTFSVLGREPAVPVLVQIEAKDVRLVDVIRDIGLQSGSRAKVVVNPKTKTIEYAYGI